MRGQGFVEDNHWCPDTGCRLLPLTLGATARLLEAGPLIFMGDSHIRNLFNAVVAGLRGARYFVESHEPFPQPTMAIVYQWCQEGGRHRGNVTVLPDLQGTVRQALLQMQGRQVVFAVVAAVRPVSRPAGTWWCCGRCSPAWWW